VRLKARKVVIIPPVVTLALLQTGLSDALQHRPFVAVPLLFVAGFVQSFCLVPLAAVMLRDSSDEMRGRVMGIWSLVFGAMIPLGSLEAGSIAHWTSTPFALGFGAVICAVSGIVTRIIVARRERQSAK